MIAPTTDDDREIVKISTVVQAGGQRVNVALKAWRYLSGGLVMWEVRHVMESFDVGETKRWNAGRIINVNMGNVKHVMQDMGIEFYHHFCPSRKAFDSDPGFYGQFNYSPSLIRTEFSCTTLGLLIWLATWSSQRHTVKDKNACLGMLVGIFTDTLATSDFIYPKLLELLAEQLEVCTLKNAQEKACRHMRYEFRHISRNAADFSWSDFADVLVSLCYERECDAAREVSYKLFDHVSNIVAKAMHDKGKIDPLKDLRALATSCKRRRIDEDARSALLSFGAGHGRMNSRTASLSFDVGTEKTAHNEQLFSVKCQRLASAREITCTGAVITADDSSGHGKPSENTLLSIVWDGVTNVTAPGIPVVGPPLNI